MNWVNRKYEKHEKLLKMIYLKNYCTDFMFLVVMVCITYSSTRLSLIFFNFPLVFEILILCVEI